MIYKVLLHCVHHLDASTNLQPSTETLRSTTNTADPTPAQEEVTQKVNTENDILMGLC